MPRLRRKRAFIIGPVREITDAEKKAIGAYVLRLEKQGYHVHWPLRDTHQSDPIGSQILNENCWEIERADEIHI